ncbi:phosphatase PAP2 family protein [bacterium]|nr:phosphatase PAP2 family protein [candidate division CSSED10-310 bacterium]
MNRTRSLADTVVVKLSFLMCFWLIWFTTYSWLNARGTRTGVYWQSPGIYVSWFVYPYVFGMAALIILPWFFNWIKPRFFSLMILYIITSLILFLVYYFYPVMMTRRSYDGPGVPDTLMRWIIGLDDPANCFPSNHCALATLGCIGVYIRTRSPVWRWMAGTLTGIVCLSTVLVGQHYWIDIPSGILTSLLTYRLMAECGGFKVESLPHQPIDPSRHRSEIPRNPIQKRNTHESR